ncbi:MAG TPA: hypothetical protein PLU10_03405 [Chitinophagaceae bacterium]|nr:hypothetical protein [Chitinophagaceae bacterium]
MNFKFSILVTLLLISVISLHAQLTLDSTFSADGIMVDSNTTTTPHIFRYEKMLELGNGSYIASGLGSIHKILPNGGFDATFGSNGSATFPIPSNFVPSSVKGVAKQRDGKLVVLAEVTYLNYVNPFFAVFRYNSNGTIDNTFHGNGYLIDSLGMNSAATPAALAIDTISYEGNDQIYFAGNHGYCTNSGSGGTYCPAGFFICKLLSNGNYDPSFHQTGIWQGTDFPVGPGSYYATSFINSIHILSKSSIVLTGYSSSSINYSYYAIKITPTGTCNLNFGNNGLWKLDDPNSSPLTFVYSKRLGSDKLLMYKNSLYTTDTVHVSYFCLDTSGQTVTSFANNGIGTYSMRIYKGPGIAFANIPTSIDLNNNIYSSFYRKTNTTSYLHILKVKANGQQDMAFGNGGILKSEPFANDYCLNGNMSYDMLFTKDNKLVVSIYKDLYMYSGGGLLRYKGLGAVTFLPTVDALNYTIYAAPQTLYIQSPESGLHHVILFASNGSVVYKGDISLLADSRAALSIPNVSAGVYIVQVVANGQSGIQKIMIP